MGLKLTSVSINRNAHPNTVFAGMQNASGEMVSVQIHFEASMNVDDFTLRQIEQLALEKVKHLGE